MRRIFILSTLALIAIVPAGAAALYFTQRDTEVAAAKPCFIAGNTGYQLAAGSTAGHIVRIDNDAAEPNLRLQRVDDPAAADFVLVDDNEATATCKDVSVVNTIAIDAAAEKPDLIVAVSRAPAGYKFYLHSAAYTEQDAAALAAVIWQRTNNKNRIKTSANAMRTVSR